MLQYVWKYQSHVVSSNSSNLISLYLQNATYKPKFGRHLSGGK
jgi:hypothetical protein